MARTRKQYRALTISEACSYGRNPAPQLRIQGLWLKDLGFNIGDPVKVKCENGQLIITPDPVRTQEIKEEKLFMEEETRKLRARYQKEKEEIHARYVAEHQQEYGS